MFCPNCGTKVSDDSMFCEECGTKLDPIADSAAAGSGPAQSSAPPAFRQEADAPPASGEKKPLGGNKKTLVIIAAAVLFIIVAAFGMKFAGGGGYKQPLSKVRDLVNKQETDIQRYVDALFPKFIVKAYDNCMDIVKDVDEIQDAMDDLEDELKDGFDMFEDEYGKHWKVSFEIVDEEQMDKDELKSVRKRYRSLRDAVKMLKAGGSYYSALEDELDSSKLKKFEKLVDDLSDDLKNIEVTDGYRLEVELKIEGDDGDDVDEAEIYVIKMNGKWCIDLTSGEFNLLGNLLW